MTQRDFFYPLIHSLQIAIIAGIEQSWGQQLRASFGSPTCVEGAQTLAQSSVAFARLTESKIRTGAVGTRTCDIWAAVFNGSSLSCYYAIPKSRFTVHGLNEAILPCYICALICLCLWIYGTQSYLIYALYYKLYIFIYSV